MTLITTSKSSTIYDLKTAKTGTSTIKQYEPVIYGEMKNFFVK
jgi:hypothetical protein